VLKIQFKTLKTGDAIMILYTPRGGTETGDGVVSGERGKKDLNKSRVLRYK